MALNEAGGSRRSNLTKEQKREAEATLYALAPQRMNDTLSPQDIAQMRALLARHDQEQPVGIQEFDLNKPPKLPYTHQPYPAMLYLHATRKIGVADNASERRALEAAGYVDEPFAREAPAAAAPSLEEEMEQLEIKLKALKKKAAAAK